MLRSTLLLTLLSLQGVFAESGGEGRAVVVSHTDSSKRAALPGHDFGRARKRQDDDDDAEKQFSLPEMQHMGGDLSIENMDAIEAVDLPRLETVDGNLTVAGNGNLETLALPVLRHVGGHLVLDGRFTTLDLPALAEVGGTVSVASTRAGFNCSAFEDALADVDVGGDVLCQSPNGDDDNNEDDDEDTDDGGDSSDAAGPPRFSWLTLLVVPALLML